LAEFAIYRTTRLERLHGQEFVRRDEAVAIVLEDLAPFLPEELVPDALSLLQDVQSLQDRWRALSALAPRLDEGYRQSALTEELNVVRQLDLDAGERCKALIALAPHMSVMERAHLLAEAIALASQIDTPWNCASSIAGLAPHLSQPQLFDALAVARGI